MVPYWLSRQPDLTGHLTLIATTSHPNSDPHSQTDLLCIRPPNPGIFLHPASVLTSWLLARSPSVCSPPQNPTATGAPSAGTSAPRRLPPPPRALTAVGGGGGWFSITWVFLPPRPSLPACFLQRQGAQMMVWIMGGLGGESAGEGVP